MVRSVHIFSAALVAFAFAATAADAETTRTPTIHTRAKHHTKPKEPEGRQITVHKSTPSWLTLGPDAGVGAGNSYVTDTFNQPSPVEGTFAGMRGRERLDANRFTGPVVPLFRF
jgi:hypothetical protein